MERNQKQWHLVSWRKGRNVCTAESIFGEGYKALGFQFCSTYYDHAVNETLNAGDYRVAGDFSILFGIQPECPQLHSNTSINPVTILSWGVVNSPWSLGSCLNPPELGSSFRERHNSWAEVPVGSCYQAVRARAKPWLPGSCAYAKACPLPWMLT